ncbi:MULTISPECIES: ABC transporter ATP-binding protein [Pseudothermotoga]|jgi:branched-chain amino acid transport system ATP-binding protein|uniref:ABC transporter related n=1 Tax=Thermotoga petrophila TaxID=93929 RepID=A0A117L275_9THEM|nr:MULTISPECIES: ABC transporter ATP-binding protein [Pseudothermotoga]KUK22281.1 MAG: ABC transporter related [Thermotoga petrophila]MDI3494559.1 branched-chain amino acid transport system ATP-binding protein [Pseudothermotoga sp.]MDK2883564.1 branched-chain amino acid transport system ATP-binding protein [Pseudothermotoga sp.]
MLVVNDLCVNYGAIKALKGISFRVDRGSIVALIGSNGAGKTTTLKAICGLVKIRSGKILFNDEDITNKPTNQIVSRRITMVPEGRRIFPNLTVYENLLIGAYQRSDKNGIKEDMEFVFSLFPRLKERVDQKGGTLSGGEQQMLAIGRALMSKPDLLMLDEPSLGLAPIIVEELFEIIQKIHKEGKTILLIEQNAYAALNIADYAYVVETGRIVLHGNGKELLNNEKVKYAYLGG